MAYLGEVVCKVCGDPIQRGKGNKGLQLCNKHYIQYRRGEPKKCVVCGRLTKVRRVHNPVCANCEVILKAERYVQEQNDRFSRASLFPIENRLREYWHYLTKSYGDRPKPIWEAFYPIDDLLSNEAISLQARWDEVESFRKTQRVRYKAALYAYMEYLAFSGYISPRKQMLLEQAYTRLYGEVPYGYREPFMKYVEFCLNKRQLDRWTVLIEADDLRDFLIWLNESTNGSHIGSVQETNIQNYLVALRSSMSQKTVYLAWKAIRDFFKWAKIQRLAFINPAEDIQVKAPVKNPEALALGRATAIGYKMAR